MRIPRWSFALLLAIAVLLPTSAKAQTYTAVSGTVLDPNGLPYSGALITFSLTAHSGQATITPCVVSPCPVHVPGTAQADATGKFTVTLLANGSMLPAGIQWVIGVTEPGVPLPWGTGPQQFTYTFTASGSSMDLSAAMSALAPALTQNFPGGGGSGPSGAIVVCLSSQVNCKYPVVGGVQYVNDASWTNALNTIATGSSDPPFTAADVGKIEFGSSACNTANGYVSKCTLEVPQGTITGFTDAHHVTVSLAATATSDGTVGWFAWGTADDGPALATAYAAVQQRASASPITNGGNQITLPCSSMFVASAPFETTINHVGPIDLEGCAAAYLIPLPSFNYSTCTAAAPPAGVISGQDFGCIFTDWLVNETALGFFEQSPGLYDVVRNVNVWGLGLIAPGMTTAKEATIFAGNSLYMENDSTVGWNPGIPYGASVKRCGFDVSSSHLLHSFDWNSGACGIRVENWDVTQTPTVIDHGFYTMLYGVDGNAGMYIAITTGNGVVETNHVGFEGQNCATPTDCDVYQPSGGIWLSTDDQTSADIAAGTDTIRGLRSTVQGFIVSGGTVHFSQSIFSGLTGAGLYQTGGTVFDDCGNTFGTSGSFTGGSLFGSCSITGTAQTAANITPSTGWGTSGAAGNGVSAVSGDSHAEYFTVTAAGTPTANPKIAIVFPTSFWQAAHCQANEISSTGTNGFSDTIQSTLPTATGVTLTWEGTPVPGSTYTFVLMCQ